MTKTIKILHLEDVELDTDLVNQVLKKAEIETEILVVETKEDYMHALIEFAPDIILCDHTLPSFNSTEALKIFQQTGLKIPFILVTANISEQYAVSIIKAGASDYILKENLESLPAAIVNALEKREQETSLENKKTLIINEKTNAVLVAQEIERHQMANDLLENINQILAASNLYIDCAINEQDKRMHFLQNSKKYILLAIDEIKQLSQVIMPPTLEETGLIESLNHWIKFRSQPGLIHFDTEWIHINEGLINKKLQLTIYRLVQEQIKNTIKYAATQNITVSLEQTTDTLTLTIKDDGIGFDIARAMEGVELQNINTRAEIHSGKLLLHSDAEKGTLFMVVFPI
ncbi:MAG: response regulator [Ferruginibacter sp.]